MADGKAEAYAVSSAIQIIWRHNVNFDLKKVQERFADIHATSVILALPAVVLDGRVWHNADQSTAHWEIKYLRIRGLLMHNPENTSLVLVRSI
jgi:hypothetical protein